MCCNSENIARAFITAVQFLMFGAQRQFPTFKLSPLLSVTRIKKFIAQVLSNRGVVRLAYQISASFRVGFLSEPAPPPFKLNTYVADASFVEFYAWAVFRQHTLCTSSHLFTPKARCFTSVVRFVPVARDIRSARANFHHFAHTLNAASKVLLIAFSVNAGSEKKELENPLAPLAAR